MSDHITAHFPKLTPDNFCITSSHDISYNCIAWAAQRTDINWWPLENSEEAFWPDGVPRERTLAAFEAMFATLGYAPCEHGQFELGFEKIALFADLDGIPTHAARQLENGRWTSKLGKAEDIEHDLHDVEGELYGIVVLFMKRAKAGMHTAE